MSATINTRRRSGFWRARGIATLPPMLCPSRIGLAGHGGRGRPKHLLPCPDSPLCRCGANPRGSVGRASGLGTGRRACGQSSASWCGNRTSRAARQEQARVRPEFVRSGKVARWKRSGFGVQLRRFGPVIRMRPSGLTTTLPSWVPERRVIVPPWANPNALKLGQRVAETCRSGGSGCASSVSDPEFPERWSSTESAFPASQWRVRVLSANHCASSAKPRIVASSVSNCTRSFHGWKDGHASPKRRLMIPSVITTSNKV